MAHSSHNQADVVDGIGENGPDQYRAMVWFVAVIFLGLGMMFAGARVDGWLYANDAEMLDNAAYQENRRASVSLASDSIDPRADGNFGTLTDKLTEKNQ